MIWIIILGLLIIIITGLKQSKLKNTSDNHSKVQNNEVEIGMFFMNESTRIEKSSFDVDKRLIADYYFALGCASQGRLDETKEWLEGFKSTKLSQFCKDHSSQILKMARIAKEVDDKPMIGIRNGETTGQYFDRMVSKRPAFMKEFEYFKNFDIQKYLSSIQ